MSHPNHNQILHKYITKRARSKYVDFSAYLVGVMGNLAVIPQIIKAWSGPSPGLAVTTWVFFMIIGIVWLFYAIRHKQKPLIMAQAIGLSCNTMVVVGWLVNNSF